ncbi:MAG: T9SS type A sorting domain-containing protein [Saprospirales bacterium]|nr:T9SS type A sorting domain-containing protein [Saprospirales bacterium]
MGNYWFRARGWDYHAKCRSTSTLIRQLAPIAIGGGRQFYRLKQMDYDGTFDYSPIRVVDIGPPSNSIRVFPNPAREEVTIAFSEPTEVRGALWLFDQNGRLVSESVIAPQTTEFQLRLAQLPSGTYILKVKVGTKEWTKRLVVE